MTIASFFSSFVVHADASSSEEEPAKENSDVEKADAEVVVEKADSEEVVEKVAPEEAEEEEPEDVRVFKDSSYLTSFQSIRSYSSILSFAKNVKRQQNALL